MGSSCRCPGEKLLEAKVLGGRGGLVLLARGRGREGEGVEVEEGRRGVSRWGACGGVWRGRREGRCRAAGARGVCSFCVAPCFALAAHLLGALLACAGQLQRRWCAERCGWEKEELWLAVVLHWFDTEGVGRSRLPAREPARLDGEGASR